MTAPDHGVRPCCFPECRQLIPRNNSFPVCRKCGVKTAIFFLNDAELQTGVLAERYRRIEEHRNQRKEHRQKTEVVYYVDLGDYIKIGYSSTLRGRLMALRVEPHHLLAWEPGGRDLEKSRHDQFRAARVGQKENFARTPELESHVAAIRAEHDVPDWAKVPDARVKIRRSK